MKNAKRLLAMCLAVVMMTAVPVWAAHTVPSDIYPGTTVFYGTLETGIYGMMYHTLPYPITSNYFNALNLDEMISGFTYHDKNYRYADWIKLIREIYGDNYKTSSTFHQALAYWWAESYAADSPEVWPVEYFDIYEKDISNYTNAISPLATDENPGLLQFRAGDYSIENGALYVNCEADYSIEYSHEFYTDSGHNNIYEVLIDNDFKVTAYCAVTDKTTGDMVYFKPGYGTDGYTFEITPEYEYGRAREINYTYYDETGWSLEKDLGVSPYSVQGNFSGTSTGVARFQLPSFYDPANHDITICFRTVGYKETFLGRLSPYSDYYTFTYHNTAEYYTPYKLSDSNYIPPASDPIPGDVDGDGALSTTDISHFARKLSTGETLGMEADITGDGVVNVTDLATMRRILSGGKL